LFYYQDMHPRHYCWRAEWRDETDNRATPPIGYCPSTASFSVRPYCKNARLDRCQKYHNCFPFGELEETTRTSSNYVDEDYPGEDYPARPEIKQSLPGWGDNYGSESSTLETNVCVWCYAPLVLHATQEEEDCCQSFPWILVTCIQIYLHFVHCLITAVINHVLLLLFWVINLCEPVTSLSSKRINSYSLNR